MSQIKIGKPLPPDFEAHYRKKSFEAFKRDLKPVEGIELVIKNLHSPFCVASNGPKNKVEFNLTNTGLFPYFEGKIFSAYEVKKWKPNPTLFLTAAEFFNAKPENCLVVEDSLSGVKAGLNAGMNVLGFAHGKNINILESEGVKTFQKMTDLLSFV